jgi:HNH endonuclease
VRARPWRRCRRVDALSYRIACGHCGISVEKRQRNALYCSRRCNRASFRQKHPEKESTYRARERDARQAVPKFTPLHYCRCIQCQRTFIAPRTRKRCAECVKALARANARARSVRQHIVSMHRCKQCGSAFDQHYGIRRRTFCSAQCAKRFSRSQAGRNVQRAKHAGVERKYFNELRIFERDGWRCRLCGCATPRRLRGRHKPNSPELDHVIPLARGGPHLPENVQCVCRKCNSAKGARELGQIWLAGFALPHKERGIGGSIPAAQRFGTARAPQNFNDSAKTGPG